MSNIARPASRPQVSPAPAAHAPAVARRVVSPYSADELASFARKATQLYALGDSWVKAARTLGIAYPTLRRALVAEGVDIGTRGRRTKPGSTRRRTPTPAEIPALEPSVEAPAPALSVPSTSDASGERTLTLRLPIDALVEHNRALILDLILKGHPAPVAAAVRALLEVD